MKQLNRTIQTIALVLGIVTILSTSGFSQDNSSASDILGDSFTTYITFNGEQSLIAYYVPDTYDSLIPSKMILALHYCNGSGEYDAISYRNLLINLADQINAIVVAPYCHNSGYPSYAIPDPSIITVSIDSSMAFLNINPDRIYLTGGSCNGRSTLKYGLEEIYDFIGIIPFNAYIPTFDPGYYNFDSEMPSCICSGTLDASYNNNVRVYDSLVAHNAVTHLNSMPGIGHEFNFPGFTDEMHKCIDFIDSVALITSVNPQFESLGNSILLYPNPVTETLNIQLISDRSGEVRVELCDLTGRVTKRLHHGTLTEGSNRITLHVQRGMFSQGLNIVKVSTNNQVAYKKLVVTY
ncbi:T9SS type A sorting domain-containing protein [Bacteroidota bacterium]